MWPVANELNSTGLESSAVYNDIPRSKCALSSVLFELSNYLKPVFLDGEISYSCN